MGLTRALDGADLVRPPLFLFGREKRPRIMVTARVGVAYSGPWADKPWRFYDANSRCVSRPPRNSIGSG
jgi:DNA-3-methyladenine glycosylase